MVSGEYIWKYTHNGFDFSILGNTPITFPVDWHNSKIPGYALRAEVPEIRGFSAYFVTSSVAARFFPPQVAGAGATSGVAVGTGYPFRIDHDEKFNETTHFQYTVSHEVVGGTACGAASTGASTRAWWPAQRLAMDRQIPDSRAAPQQPCGSSTTTLLDGTPAIAMVDTNIPPGPATNGAPLPLTADEEFQAGFACNGEKATPTQALACCLPGQSSSPRA